MSQPPDSQPPNLQLPSPQLPSPQLPSPQPLSILHLMGSFRLPQRPDQDGYSGVARATLELARQQAQLGHRVCVASVGPQGWQADWQGVRLRQLRHLPWARLRLGARVLDLSLHLPALLLTRCQHFDVVHGQMYPSLRGLRAPVRVSTFHSDPADLSPAVVQGAAASTQAQLGVSEFVSAGLRQHLGSAGHVQTVLNGVDPAQFAPGRWAGERARLRQGWGVPEDGVVFLYAGATVPEKGLLPLAQAFAQLGDPELSDPLLGDAQAGNAAWLVVAGDAQLWDLTLSAHPSGGYDQQVTAALAGHRRVQRLGRVRADDMAALYAACDVLVVPSLVRETFSLSALEAMASGLPVIAAERGALPEVIGAGGLLYPPGEAALGGVAGLETLMTRLTRDAALRRQLGQQALARARQLSWAATARHLDTLYQRCLTQHHLGD